MNDKPETYSEIDDDFNSAPSEKPVKSKPKPKPTEDFKEISLDESSVKQTEEA